MTYKSLTCITEDHIAAITLVSHNVDQQLARELQDVCTKMRQDASVYVVTITGVGNGVFCLGSELEQLALSGARLPADLEIAAYRVAAAVAGIERPVIAVVNGDAVGQGLELALGCDIRLASEGARFGLPQATLGLIPFDGGTQRLSRIVGKARALELVLTGETISAAEAQRIGLINRVVPVQDLLTEAHTLAEALASKAPIALRYAKEAVEKGLDLTMEQGLRLESDLYFLLQTTSDRTEGIRAFLEKRAPRFEGR